MNYIDEYITAPIKVLYNKSHTYIKIIFITKMMIKT